MADSKTFGPYDQNEAAYLKAALDWYQRVAKPSTYDIVSVRPTKDRSDAIRHSESFDDVTKMLTRWGEIKANPSSSYNYYAAFDPTKQGYYVDSLFIPPKPLAPVVITKMSPAKTAAIGILGSLGLLALMAKAK